MTCDKTVAERLRESSEGPCSGRAIRKACSGNEISDEECNQSYCGGCRVTELHRLADLIEAEEAKIAADATRAAMETLDQYKAKAREAAKYAERREKEIMALKDELERTKTEHDGVDVAALLNLADDLEETNRRTGKVHLQPIEAADHLREIVKGAKPQLPEGIIWPTFEDGELVRFGDEYVNALGNTAPVERIMFTANGYKVNRGQRRNFMQEYGTPVKRPEPEVLDADGVKINVGDTVYSNGGLFADTFVVEGFDNVMRVIAKSPTVNETVIAYGPNFTHRKPDSMEAVEEDADLFALTLDADDERLFRSLMERQRKLLGGE